MTSKIDDIFCGYKSGTNDANLSYTFFLSFRYHVAFNNSPDSEVIKYACDYYALPNYYYMIFYISGITHMLLAAVGFLGDILVLATICRNKEFQANSFWVHRIVAMLNLVNTPFKTGLGGLSQIYVDRMFSSYTFFIFIEIVATTVSQIVGFIVTFLIAFLSINRTVATLLPTKFYLINRWQVLVGVLFSIVGLACLSYIPYIFANEIVFDPSNKHYALVQSKFGKTQFYLNFQIFIDKFLYCRAIVQIVAMIFSVGGMLRARALR